MRMLNKTNMTVGEDTELYYGLHNFTLMNNTNTSDLGIPLVAPTHPPITTASILACFFLGTIILIIIFGNTMVIIAVLRDRHLKQALQNRFIISLAVADMFLGMFIMPLSLHLEVLRYWALGKVLCDIWLALDVFLCTGSTLSLVVISLDRYWSVTKALEYPQTRTPKRVNITIAGLWITSGVVSVPPLAGWVSNSPSVGDVSPQCNLADELGYIIYSLTISFYIPLIIILIAYGRIFQVARRRANHHIKLGTIHNIQPNNGNPQGEQVEKTEVSTADSIATCEDDKEITAAENHREPRNHGSISINNNEEEVKLKHVPEVPAKRAWKFTIFASSFMHRPYSKYSKTNSKDQKDVKQSEALLKDRPSVRKVNQKILRERRATVTIAIIVMAFVICWLPFSIIYLIDRLCLCGLRDHPVFTVTFWLGYCNSAVNPVVYSIFNRDFRLAFQRLLCKKR